MTSMDIKNLWREVHGKAVWCPSDFQMAKWARRYEDDVLTRSITKLDIKGSPAAVLGRVESALLHGSLKPSLLNKPVVDFKEETDWMRERCVQVLKQTQHVFLKNYEAELEQREDEQ